jgi:hypothetical protein
VPNHITLNQYFANGLVVVLMMIGVVLNVAVVRSAGMDFFAVTRGSGLAWIGYAILVALSRPTGLPIDKHLIVFVAVLSAIGFLLNLRLFVMAAASV